MIEISDTWRRAHNLIHALQRGELAASAAAAAGDQDMAWLWMVACTDMAADLASLLGGAAAELAPPLPSQPIGEG